MTATIDSDLDALADEFELLGNWEERYRHIIDLGRGLEPLSEAERSEANRVHGCASQVWLVSEPSSRAGPIHFRGDSDAHIVRGLMALVLRLLSDRPRAEVAGFDARSAFQRLGLAGALSTQRSNGLAAMVERIRREAAAPAA